MTFSITGLSSFLNDIHISLVSAWEVNFVLFNSNLSTDIDPLAKVLWPISVSLDDSDPDMEKGMH
jgi:hypothetical protein